MKSSESSVTGTCDAAVQGCVAAAAAIISTKWTPQLIYALSSGVKRFSSLQKEVGGINPRTLSARLDELEDAGIVRKVSYHEVPPRIEYSLTDKGSDLLPILHCMVDWGEKHAPRPAVPTQSSDRIL
jgi:DNA-binding HxlR family transcriptional regulator